MGSDISNFRVKIQPILGRRWWFVGLRPIQNCWRVKLLFELWKQQLCTSWLRVRSTRARATEIWLWRSEDRAKLWFYCHRWLWDWIFATLLGEHARSAKQLDLWTARQVIVQHGLVRVEGLRCERGKRPKEGRSYTYTTSSAVPRLVRPCRWLQARHYFCK